jgi:hypothetical protein
VGGAADELLHFVGDEGSEQGLQVLVGQLDEQATEVTR